MVIVPLVVFEGIVEYNREKHVGLVIDPDSHIYRNKPRPLSLKTDKESQIINRNFKSTKSNAKLEALCGEVVSINHHLGR